MTNMNLVASDGPARTRDELEFLPAALEIQETPPNPIGRWLMWCVVAIVLATILWASLDHIDIVAIAPGKLIPSDRVKVIQPLATGQVRAIHVRDGQKVKSGQILIELDSTLAQADRDRLSKQLSDDQAALARQRAFATWLETGRSATKDVSVGLQRAFLDQLVAEHRAKLAAIDQSLERRRAEKNATAMLVEKGERTLPLISARAASVAKLASDNLVSRNSNLELEQERIEAEQDLAAQRANLQSISAAINELSEQRASAHAEARRIAFQAIEELENRVSALQQEVLKAKTITSQQALSSPVDGVVQQLNVHTIGGVVTPAEQLMVIVPNGQPLEVEALVLNRDIGFVTEGQRATVKVDAFPFTRYGAIKGNLVTVSKDAASDEKLGLIYPTRLRLEKASMFIDAKNVDLSPGMSVTVEIKTGQRRLIEYFLSPLIQAADESVRER
jgi:hemolysin D